MEIYSIKFVYNGILVYLENDDVMRYTLTDIVRSDKWAGTATISTGRVKNVKKIPRNTK